jgi:hypothetical protein
MYLTKELYLEYNGLLQFNNKKTTQFKDGQRISTDISPKKMTDNHMKRGSTPISQMQRAIEPCSLMERLRVLTSRWR